MSDRETRLTDLAPEDLAWINTLLHFYSKKLPQMMFTVGHVSRLSNVPTSQILAAAETMGITFNPAYPELAGHHVADILRKVHNLE